MKNETELRYSDGNGNYHFITHWRFKGPIEVIASILDDPEGMVVWWPSFYNKVKLIKISGDPNNIGNVYNFRARPFLPYSLNWNFKVLVRDYPHKYVLSADGDFQGMGVWELKQKDQYTEITYDWRIQSNNPIVNKLAFLFKPIVIWSHNWAMEKGKKSLELEIARRLAESEKIRLSIPPPPRRNFDVFVAMSMVLFIVIGVILSVRFYFKKRISL